MSPQNVQRKYIPLLGDVYMNWVTIRDPQSTTRFVATPELDLPAGGNYALLRVQVTCNTIPELVEGNLLLVDRKPPRHEILPNDLVILRIPPKLARYKMVDTAEYYVTRHVSSRRIGDEWKIIKVIRAEDLQEAGDQKGGGAKE